jgi:uncharacterized protein YndB with AHSA1/START domain
VIRRTRVLAAPAAEVWETVGDPYHLPRWWPKVKRVEGVTGGRFTTVMATAKGRPVRADHHVTEVRAPERICWAQDVEGTPFERVLKAAAVTVSVAPVDAGTQVVLELRQQLRGMSRFGGFMVRRASGRIVEEALDGLTAIHG